MELVLPTDFPAIYSEGSVSANTRLLHYWLNAYEGRLVNDSNYQWALAGNKDCRVWNNGVSTDASGGDGSRQTCTYSTSPSYRASHFPLSKQTTAIPTSNCVYYAFETPEGSQYDFDYNDVVLRVTVPVDHGDGSYVSNVQVMCVGNTLKTTVYYNGTAFGDEVHSVIGVSDEKTANVNGITRVFSYLGTLTFNDGNVRLDQLPFTLQTIDSQNKVKTYEQGSALTGSTPLFIVINGNDSRLWFWPTEGANIGLAFPQFSTWASNMHKALGWYDYSQAASAKVVTWDASDE